MDDPRLTPARPTSPRNISKARSRRRALSPARNSRYREAIAPLRRGPSPDAELATQALMGERVTIYDRNGEGFAWGQLNSDGYVGWLPDRALAKPAACADAQGHGDHGRLRSPAPRSNCRRSRRLSMGTR